MCPEAKLRKTRLKFSSTRARSIEAVLKECGSERIIKITVTFRILLNFDPFQSGKRPLSLVFNAESSYIFLHCFNFVINYKNVHKLLNSKTGALCAVLQFNKKKAEKGCPV